MNRCIYTECYFRTISNVDLMMCDIDISSWNRDVFWKGRRPIFQCAEFLDGQGKYLFRKLIQSLLLRCNWIPRGVDLRQVSVTSVFEHEFGMRCTKPACLLFSICHSSFINLLQKLGQIVRWLYRGLIWRQVRKIGPAGSETQRSHHGIWLAHKSVRLNGCLVYLCSSTAYFHFIEWYNNLAITLIFSVID